MSIDFQYALKLPGELWVAPHTAYTKYKAKKLPTTKFADKAWVTNSKLYAKVKAKEILREFGMLCIVVEVDNG